MIVPDLTVLVVAPPDVDPMLIETTSNHDRTLVGTRRQGNRRIVIPWRVASIRSPLENEVEARSVELQLTMITMQWT